MSRWRLLLRSLTARHSSGSAAASRWRDPAAPGGHRRDCPPSVAQEPYLHWVRELGAWRLHGTLLPPQHPYQPSWPPD